MRAGCALALALLVTAAAHAQDDLPQAKEKLKDYQPTSGFFTVLSKGQQAYLEVPAGYLEQPFLLATSISGGPQYTGFQWWTTVCAWKRVDDKLLLVEREVRYRVQDPRKPMNDAVRRTYTDRLIQAVPIVALDGGNPVVDLNALFGGKASEFFGNMASGLDASVVLLDEVKSFPKNTELVLTLPDRNREGRFTSLAYSFSQLPPPRMDSYHPRVADDRVGYFVTALKDFTDDKASGDRFVRYVHRWRLEKADPSLERSPVKEPIVFYIEKTVPYRFREAVREGILAWNQAFDAIGLLNAIVVRQQTDTQFEDLDPEDVRYNFFRWIVSERAFAMGPSRVNPWTGQILDADIVFDESMVRAYLRQYDLTLRKEPKEFFSPGMRRRLDADPQRYWFAHVDGDQDPDPAQEAPGRADYRVCSMGAGVAHELAIGALARGLNSPDGAYPEEFISELIKDVVMHEVGHTLGLRHNFKASTWRSLGEINAPNPPGDVCASVMDYNPINVAGEGRPQGNYTMRGLGPYDHWAIEYGYSLFPNEDQGLAATVAAVASPQHAYGTDEDTQGPDPYCVRWDLGRDPLAFAASRMQMDQRLMDQVLDRAVKAGESYEDARRAVDMLLFDYQRSGMMAARFVGGEQVYRDHKGDPDAREPLVPVPAEVQRKALRLVCDHVLAEGSLSLKPELLRHLAKGNWSHWGSRDPSLPHSYPYLERILGVQSWALFGLLNPDTLERLVDTEAKAAPGQDRVTIPEVFSAVSEAVFGKLLQPNGVKPGGTAAEPRVPTIQRNLQREYATELIELILESESGPTPAVIRDLALQEVQRIHDSLESYRKLEARWDPYTRAHVASLRTRLEKALEASFQIGGGGGGGGGTIILRVGEDGQLHPLDPNSPNALPWNEGR